MNHPRLSQFDTSRVALFMFDSGFRFYTFMDETHTDGEDFIEVVASRSCDQ